MRQNKEIMVLIALFVGMASFVIWYVIDRRARMRAPRPVAVKPVEPVDLTKHDGQTIDFSSGQAVVKDTPEDRAALEAATKEIAEASKGITFEAPRKKPEQPLPH